MLRRRSDAGSQAPAQFFLGDPGLERVVAVKGRDGRDNPVLKVFQGIAVDEGLAFLVGHQNRPCLDKLGQGRFRFLPREAGEG